MPEGNAAKKPIKNKFIKKTMYARGGRARHAAHENHEEGGRKRDSLAQKLLRTVTETRGERRKDRQPEECD